MLLRSIIVTFFVLMMSPFAIAENQDYSSSATEALEGFFRHAKIKNVENVSVQLSEKKEFQIDLIKFTENGREFEFEFIYSENSVFPHQVKVSNSNGQQGLVDVSSIFSEAEPFREQLKKKIKDLTESEDFNSAWLPQKLVHITVFAKDLMLGYFSEKRELFDKLADEFKNAIVETRLFAIHVKKEVRSVANSSCGFLALGTLFFFILIWFLLLPLWIIFPPAIIPFFIAAAVLVGGAGSC